MLIFSGAPLVLFVPGEPAIRLWLRLIATLDDDDDDDNIYTYIIYIHTYTCVVH